MNATWAALLDRKPKEDESDDDDESEIKTKFDEFMVHAANTKSLKHAKAKLVQKNMKYNISDDCIDCRCGSKLWYKKNKKRALKYSDLNSHLIENKHSNFELKEKQKKSNRISKMMKKAKEMLSDTYIKCENILYFQYFITTFIMMWFIISCRLPLHLLYNFNCLLLFIMSYVGVRGVLCTGSSYRKAYDLNNMVASFYFVRFEQLSFIARNAWWVNVTFMG